MLYNENLREEERRLIRQIAEQTESGKIGWELTEYNPLSFLNEDKVDDNPAVIGQTFSFEAISTAPVMNLMSRKILRFRPEWETTP